MISESIHSIAVAEVSMDATSISNIKAFTCRRSNWNSVCPDSMIPIKGEDSEFDVLFSGGAEGVDLGRAEELEGAKLAHLAPVGAVLGGDEVFFVVEDVLGGLVAGPAGEDVLHHQRTTREFCTENSATPPPVARKRRRPNKSSRKPPPFAKNPPPVPANGSHQLKNSPPPKEMCHENDSKPSARMVFCSDGFSGEIFSPEIYAALASRVFL
nr:uncharacterized protein LOC109164816 [Ipomoea batatas]